jgi:hypothetical protein
VQLDYYLFEEMVAEDMVVGVEGYLGFALI